MLTTLVILALVQDLAPLAHDEKAGRVSFGAKAAKTDVYPQLKGAIEFALVNARGKEYESCFVAQVDPIALYEAVKKLGIEPGAPSPDGKAPATGGKAKISVEWKDGDKDRSEPLASFVLDTTKNAPLAAAHWIFQGSKKGFDPETESMQLLVKQSKNLVGLYSGEVTPLFTNPGAPPSGHQYKVNLALLPKEGTPVKIVIEASK
jgi:hypothetical protein